MAQSVYYTNEKLNRYGNVSLEMNVFKSIAENVLKETDGVVLSDNKFLKMSKDAVLATMEDDQLGLNVDVRFQYGVPINKTAIEIQNKISDMIEELTTVVPKYVNINVVGIEF